MEKRAMMLIEAMKRLRVIEKRMGANMEQIRKYAALVSTERPFFPTEEEQKQEVRGLIQANGDLLEEYLKLKLAIEHTNLTVCIEIEGEKRTISEFLVIKRKLAKLMEETFYALNTVEAEKRRRDQRSQDREPVITRLYDERFRNEGIRKWSDLYNAIDSRLEVVNATTELRRLPA